MPKLTHELPVYTFHIDFAGHVSNIVYVQWMEVSRCKLLEAAGFSLTDLCSRGVIPVLTETHIEHRRPLYLGDTVRAEVWFSELKNVTARMQHRFYSRSGELAATGDQRGLFVLKETMRPSRPGP